MLSETCARSATLEADLQADLESIELFTEVAAAADGVRARGMKIVIASNLAKLYAAPF